MRTGRTKQQIKECPVRSIYVWVNELTDYPKRLAHSIGRDDVIFVSPRWLENLENVRGRVLTGITIDHAANMTLQQYKNLIYIRRRISELSRAQKNNSDS